MRKLIKLFIVVLLVGYSASATAQEYLDSYKNLVLYDTVSNVPEYKVIEDFENAFKDLKVYPNPTSGVIHISSESDIEAYTLCNLQGKIIQEGRTTTTIDLSELSSGIYILNLQNKEGHKKQMKVVKK